VRSPDRSRTNAVLLGESGPSGHEQDDGNHEVTVTAVLARLIPPDGIGLSPPNGRNSAFSILYVGARNESTLGGVPQRCSHRSPNPPDAAVLRLVDANDLVDRVLDVLEFVLYLPSASGEFASMWIQGS
jgi:hypothetical protein